ncbi:MAG TPA: dsDNA nuclease domain-containing protein [Acidimicrobiales bacterium]|nr:dsDNA nuclease domain-containing protein [Acidimicrobiales bacterium]
MTPVDASQIPGGDPSGSDTFARYRYQAKLTLLHWLGTLMPDGPRSVYAEHHEDILLEYDDRLVFIQVKTRVSTAGYWTADIVCSDGGGIDSLCRAYAVAKDSPCSFQLHLEGSASPSSTTASFIRDCSSAGNALRARVQALLEAALGHEVHAELDDFLARLRVVPNQPARADIDARCIRMLGRLTPGTPAGDVEDLYHRLLQIVEEAQEASDTGFGPDATGIEFLAAHLTHLIGAGTDESLVAAAKRLTRDRLTGLVPVDQPSSAALLLIERLLEARPLTALEEKLIAAGANESVVQDARRLRALAEPRRLELLAGPDAHATRLEDVSNRVLVHARAVAQLCRTAGQTTDDLWARLVTETGLADTDQGGLFNGDRQSLVGLLCCLSDECLFPWQAP